MPLRLHFLRLSKLDDCKFLYLKQHRNKRWWALRALFLHQNYSEKYQVRVYVITPIYTVGYVMFKKCANWDKSVTIIFTKIGKITIFYTNACDLFSHISKMSDKIYISIFQFKISVYTVQSIFFTRIWVKTRDLGRVFLHIKVLNVKYVPCMDQNVRM